MTTTSSKIIKMDTTSTNITSLPDDVFAMHLIPRIGFNDLVNFSSTSKTIASKCEIEFKRLFDRLQQCPHPTPKLTTYRSSLQRYIHTHKYVLQYCTGCMTCYGPNCSRMCVACSRVICPKCRGESKCRYCKDPEHCGFCGSPCSVCGDWACDDCANERKVWIETCDDCEKRYCGECVAVWECSVCGRYSCLKCKGAHCSECGEEFDESL